MRDFEYDDEAPWVTRADGGGKSLTKILSASGNRTDHPFSWRASVTNGGSPGSSDALPFSGDAGLDQDGDGLSALLEHFHGTDDTIVDPAAALFSITEASQDSTTFVMKRNLASDD